MLDISASCRTCMKDDVTLVDLYEKVKIEGNCVQLAEILVLCTPTEVSQEDGLPQKLCDECTRVLQLAYTFRNQAAKAEEEFKRLLQNEIKSEPIEFKPKTENEDDYFNSCDDFSISDDVSVVMALDPTGMKRLDDEDNVSVVSKREDVEVKPYSCSKCNKTYLKEKKFLKHLLMHESPILCTICNKSYHNQTSLDKHLAKHFKKHACTICNQNFDTEPQLLKHTTEHTDNKINIKVEQQSLLLQCPDCDLTFTKQRSLSTHRRRHKNNQKKNEFICDTCGKQFNMKHLLKRHIGLHSDVKPHRCKKCPKSYARKDQLVHHMHSHKESKPYECSYCKKGFTQLCSLKDHIRSHTGETPFLCSQCGKGFSNSSNLRQHMMRHTGLKPYACNKCPKTFCTKGQMTSHMSTHTGEHPYKCEECGAAFTKQNSLKKHSLIHLGIRPFACDTCSMRFTCKDHLKRHYRIHTGEKPYRCNYCERAFTQSNDLVKHTRAHIGQNIYQCTICGTRFRLMSELKSHYPTHFVDGKLQPALQKETTEDREVPQPLIPSSPTKELEPLLIFKQPELPLLSFNKDMPLLSLKPEEVKDMPVLNIIPMKPSSPPEGFETIAEVRTEDDKNRYTITINSCDKNGVVNGITINIPSKDS